MPASNVRWRETTRREADDSDDNDDSSSSSRDGVAVQVNCVLIMLLAVWAALLLLIRHSPSAAFLELSSTPTLEMAPVGQPPPTVVDAGAPPPAPPPPHSTSPPPPALHAEAEPVVLAAPAPAAAPPCPAPTASPRSRLPPGAAADWMFVADQDMRALSEAAVQFRFAPAAAWVDGEGAVGHLVSRLSGGCVNLRPGEKVRGHGNSVPHETAAAPSASTELRRSLEAPATAVSTDGSGRECTPPTVARFVFTGGGRPGGGTWHLAVGAAGKLKVVRQCRGAQCDFEQIEASEPAGTEAAAAAGEVAGDAAATAGRAAAEPARWFALRSVRTGQLLRLSHAALTQPPSWDGLHVRARRKRQPPRWDPESAGDGGAGGGGCRCPIAGGPRGWQHNCSEWAPLIAKYLSAWSRGNVSAPAPTPSGAADRLLSSSHHRPPLGQLSATVLDLAFWKTLYGHDRAHAVPGLHVSVKGGKLLAKTNSDYRLELISDMLVTVSRLVALPVPPPTAPAPLTPWRHAHGARTFHAGRGLRPVAPAPLLTPAPALAADAGRRVRRTSVGPPQGQLAAAAARLRALRGRRAPRRADARAVVVGREVSQLVRPFRRRPRPRKLSSATLTSAHEAPRHAQSLPSMPADAITSPPAMWHTAVTHSVCPHVLEYSRRFGLPLARSKT